MSRRKQIQIIPTKKFNDDVDFYIRKKKFFKIVTDELEKGNLVGVKPENIKVTANTAVYKVRIANNSINVGKIHEFKLIYYVMIEKKIYLLAIYSKKDDIRVLTENQIKKYIKILLEPETQEEE